MKYVRLKKNQCQGRGSSYIVYLPLYMYTRFRKCKPLKNGLDELRT